MLELVVPTRGDLRPESREEHELANRRAEAEMVLAQERSGVYRSGVSSRSSFVRCFALISLYLLAVRSPRIESEPVHYAVMHCARPQSGSSPSPELYWDTVHAQSQAISMERTLFGRSSQTD